MSPRNALYDLTFVLLFAMGPEDIAEITGLQFVADLHWSFIIGTYILLLPYVIPDERQNGPQSDESAAASTETQVQPLDDDTPEDNAVNDVDTSRSVSFEELAELFASEPSGLGTA